MNILDGLINYLGYEYEPKEDAMNEASRLLTLKWACKFGHADCRKTANTKLMDRLERGVVPQ